MVRKIEEVGRWGGSGGEVGGRGKGRQITPH